MTHTMPRQVATLAAVLSIHTLIVIGMVALFAAPAPRPLTVAAAVQGTQGT